MKLVFITGSSSGLGKALAEDFLKDGNLVYGISRSQSIRHENYKHIPMDLSDPAAYASYSFPAFEGYAEIIFINNAGSVEPIGKAGKIDFKEAVHSYHINILAPIFFINKLAEETIGFKGKCYVLNISSGAAQYPVEGWGIYCSTKSALDAHAAVVDKEMENSGRKFFIRNIYPGIIDTPMQKVIRNIKEEDFPEVDRFRNYKSAQKLIPPKDASSKIILNFNSFFASTEVVVPLA